MSAHNTQATAPRVLDEPVDLLLVHRHALRVVMLSQLLGGAGLAAGVTVGALLAEQMLGTDSLAGLPTALVTLGSALTAYVVGWVTQRRGRRFGLAAGFTAGALGAAGVASGALLDNVIVLFVALFVYGAGTATNLQARYAGTDLAPAAQRGKAISIALVDTTAGAVAGPNLVEPLGDVARRIGFPPLAGPFLLAALAYLAAGAVLLVRLRPDPYLLAREVAARAGTEVSQPADEAGDRGGRGAVVGATVMVLTQVAMVSIMTMTPVHMRAHGHALGDVGLVIGVHIGAMYLPSLATGLLVDRLGRVRVALAAAATLLAAGVVAGSAPGDSLPLLIVALALLGLGWNLGLIAGTALVVDGTSPAARPRVQGAVDVLIALCGASGGALSGVVMAGRSYAMLAVLASLLALLLVPVVVWASRVNRAAPATLGPLQ